jgi:DNA-directed RNA polymerase
MRALMPNLIHSLDAASLSLLIDKYFNAYNNETKNIFAIHDCFGTTCNNMKYVIDSLKLIYISIYADKKYLRELDDNMIHHIQNNIDESFDNINKRNITILASLTKTKIKEIILDYPDINKVLINDFDIKKYIHFKFIKNS